MTAPAVLRIIGGQYKRTPLPVADKPGLRPTPSRVRETLFDWLGHDLKGWRCIDVFAGTGALGFEAASRGAEQVLLIEQDPGLVRQLLALQAKLQAAMVQIERGDGLSRLQCQTPQSLQLVLLDPPFDEALFTQAQRQAALRAAAAALSPAGYAYWEAALPWSEDALLACGLVLHRHLKAGAVHAHLLRPAA
ncbi:MAG: RsmD family RNA methyltransferase [Burkholderiaceae bacterium]